MCKTRISSYRPVLPADVPAVVPVVGGGNDGRIAVAGYSAKASALA